MKSDKPSMNTGSFLILIFRHLLTLIVLDISFICLSVPIITIVPASIALIKSIEHIKNDEGLKSVMLAFVKLKKKDMMRNALILWFMYPIRTFLSSLLFILPVLVLVWWLFQATPIVMTIGFSGIFFVLSWTHRPLKDRLISSR